MFTDRVCHGHLVKSVEHTKAARCTNLYNQLFSLPNALILSCEGVAEVVELSKMGLGQAEQLYTLV